jgi:hypothetical protein
MSDTVQSGPAPPIPPRWKRELRLLRRDGLVKYVRVAWALRRFHRTLRRNERRRGG